MKKGTFNITTIEGSEERTGYLFKYDGVAFGVHSRSKNWYVLTELTSGYEVPLPIKAGVHKRSRNDIKDFLLSKDGEACMKKVKEAVAAIVDTPKFDVDLDSLPELEEN